MVYSVVKQNQGFIHAYSEPGKGTSFRIYLPCHKGAAGVTVDSADRKGEGIIAGHGETVLVVEDEAGILKMVRIMLKKIGYSVLTAGTKDEAIRLAETHPGGIRLLITDVVMPEMNGRELADRLLLLEPGLHLLFMSGYTSDVIARMGVLEKGVSFIQKPFSIKELAIKVCEAIEKNPDSV
jgi:CheY-like chemotaxis protein